MRSVAVTERGLARAGKVFRYRQKVIGVQEPAPQEFAKAKIRYRRAPGRSVEANIGEYATKSSGRGRG